MKVVTETIREVFPRGTLITCESVGDGPFVRYEARVAAAQDHVVHLNLLDGVNAETIAGVGRELHVARDTPNGRFLARAQRIDNAVPEGLTIKILSGPSKVERREYLRVRCEVPLHWSVIGRAEAERRAKEILGSTTGQRAVARIENHELGHVLTTVLDRLDSIERKLDDLLRGEADGAEPADAIVDLSGSGMRFLTDRRVQVGNLVDATLMFEGASPSRVDVVGRVVRVEPPNLVRTCYAVACRFTAIDEKDREGLIRHTFRIQRHRLRRSVV